MSRFALLALGVLLQLSPSRPPAAVTPATRTLPMAFDLPVPGLIAEGLAYDPIGGALYVSTVRGQAIYCQSLGSKLRRFSQPVDSLSGVFGLAVDARRKQLWAGTGTLPHLATPAAAAPGAALVRYQLPGGPARRFPVPSDDRPHLLGDVLPAPDGTVYATDSRTPTLYRLCPGQACPEPWLRDSLFYSLQGLILLPGGRTLLLADYRHGLLAVNLRTGRVRAVTAPPTDALRGLDGLYRPTGTTLLATRNHVAPHRVLRLMLDTTSWQVRTAVPVATPPLPDLTLGAVAGSRFYFISRSGWANFDEQGHLLASPAPQPAHIDSVPLAAALR